MSFLMVQDDNDLYGTLPLSVVDENIGKIVPPAEKKGAAADSSEVTPYPVNTSPCLVITGSLRKCLHRQWQVMPCASAEDALYHIVHKPLSQGICGYDGALEETKLPLQARGFRPGWSSLLQTHCLAKLSDTVCCC